jgi:hypothetical protein
MSSLIHDKRILTFVLVAVGLAMVAGVMVSPSVHMPTVVTIMTTRTITITTRSIIGITTAMMTTKIHDP